MCNNKITVSLVLFKNIVADVENVCRLICGEAICKLIVIDNSPSNELEKFVVGISNKIQYVFNNKNYGYGTAHNIGINQSIKDEADYHVVLNPDVVFSNGVFEKLSTYMNKNRKCGLVMPKIIYPDGSVQYLCKLLPNPWDLFGRRFIPFKEYKEKRNYKYELIFSGYSQIMQVPSLSGCFMFMRVSVLKEIGGFDERFFMYAEDLDLSRRIGMISETIFNPNIVAIHGYEKGSYKNLRLLKFHLVSVFKYFNKWGWFFDAHRKQINEECLNNLGYK